MSSVACVRVANTNTACRKKAEQAAARDEIKQARQDGVDVDGGSEHRRSQVGNESLGEA